MRQRPASVAFGKRSFVTQDPSPRYAQRHTRIPQFTTKQSYDPSPAQPNNNNPCFLEGTKISTPSGDRLVQDLRIGDEVRTLAGRKKIKSIGYNKFTKEEGRAWQDSVMPIRVAPFAINEHIPYRDLYLSPGHCVFYNEALIPVKYLVNETSIAQATPSEMFLHSSTITWSLIHMK